MRSIHEAASLAASHYRRFLDPKLNIPYFYAFFPPEGALGAHCEWDFGDATGRYLDALITCRRLLGDAPYPEEHTLKAALTAMFAKDGLNYRPDLPPLSDGTANTFDQRSVLVGLNTWYQDSHDQKVKALIDALLRGIRAIGVWWQNYFYIPYIGYRAGDVPEIRPFERVEELADPCHYGGGVMILPLMQYYHMTREPLALELAKGLTCFSLEHAQVFDRDGSFWVNGLSDCDGHFHSRMGTVCGALYCALELGRRDWVDRCLGIYRFARAQGTSYGLFPEGLGKRPLTGAPDEYPDVARHSEMCGTTDMLHIALLLSSRGIADAWDDAEKFANQLFASQLEDISWVPPSSGAPDDLIHTHTDVAARYRGAFTGRTQANDLLNEGRYDTMGCCAAAGGRALGLLRRHAAVWGANVLMVNLWLGMDDETLKSVPGGDGSLAITLKQATRGFGSGARIDDTHEPLVTPEQTERVLVRWPGWLRDLRVTMAGQAVHYGCVRINGALYIDLGDVLVGQTMQIQPLNMADLWREEIYCGETLKVCWRGNVVRDVLPRGIRPLYTGGEGA